MTGINCILYILKYILNTLKQKTIFYTNTHNDNALQPLSSLWADSETMTVHGKLSPLLEESSSDIHPQYVYMWLQEPSHF